MLKRILVVICLSLILLASSWTLLKPGFFRVHDYVHAARVAEMTRALEQGHFPVRWSPNFGYGYGMPLFEFYAPLPYYVGAALYWSGVPILVVLKVLFLASAVGALMGSYRLGTSLFGRTGGLLTAAAYTLAPYRAVNLYIRGALSEAWGIMALPWILWGVVKIIKREKHGWQVLVMGLVTLLLSHNLTTMMFVPLSLVFAVGYWFIHTIVSRPAKTSWWGALTQSPRETLITWLTMTGSYLLSLGLSAFYVFPALLEKDFTKVQSIVGGYFDYHLHFLYIRQFLTPNWGYGGSGWGPQDEISFFLGYGQLIGLTVTGLLVASGLILWLIHFRSRKQQHGTRWLSWPEQGVFKVTALAGLTLGLMGISLLMTLQKTLWIWDAVPFLSFVQFPWRWLSAGILFLSLMVGLAATLLTTKYRYTYAAVLLLVIVGGNYYYFRPEKYLDNPYGYYYTQEQPIREAMSDILQDYIPVQMPKLLKPPTQVVMCGDGECGQTVTVVIDRGHEKLAQTHFTTTQDLSWSVANFPGWYAEIDGQRQSLNTTAGGTLSVTVPAGEHLVGIRFGRTPVRQVSDLISGVSALLLLLLLLPITKKIRHD